MLPSSTPDKHKRLSGLLGVKLDDEMFLEGEVNIISARECSNLCYYLSLIKLNPLGSDVRIKGLNKSLELLGRTALFAKRNNVTCANDKGRNVYLLTVKTEVAVCYKLTSFLTAACKTDSVNNVIETSFKKRKKVFTRYALSLISLLEIALELTFENTVVSLSLLLFAELSETEVLPSVP